VLVVSLSFMFIPRITEKPKLTTIESNNAFEQYWKVLPHGIYAHAWLFNTDFKDFLISNIPIEYTSGTGSDNVLNAPLWKQSGLKPGVALVVENSNYEMLGVVDGTFVYKNSSGTVIFCYNWLYSGNVRIDLGNNYTVVCDFAFFDVVKAAGNYTIKYI